MRGRRPANGGAQALLAGAQTSCRVHQLDRRFKGTAVGKIGPVELRLFQYGAVRNIVVGQRDPPIWNRF